MKRDRVYVTFTLAEAKALKCSVPESAIDLNLGRATSKLEAAIRVTEGYHGHKNPSTYQDK